MGYLIVFIGGGIGASLRHGFNIAFARLLGTAFSVCNVIENVSGSIVMGILVAIFAFRTGIPHRWQLFLTTGILGGYTTFSTFSLVVALLYERGQSRHSTSCCRSCFRSVGCSRGSRGSAIWPELVHRAQAEFVEKRHVTVASWIWRRQQLRPIKDRVGTGKEAECLRFFAHVFPARGQSNYRGGHRYASDSNRAHEIERVYRRRFRKRRAFNTHQHVDRYAFRMDWQTGERRDHADAIIKLLAHADNSAAADVDPRSADVPKGVEPILVGACRNDLAVEFGRRIKVVVVVVETAGLEPLRLLARQHTERDTCFHAEGLHAFDHVADLLKIAVLGRTPGRAHAKP